MRDKRHVHTNELHKSCSKLLNQILVLQKCALQLIYVALYRTHAIALFLSSNTLPIDMLYLRLIVTLMHDVSNNLASPIISDLITCFSIIYILITPVFALADNYCFEYSRLSHRSKSFLRIGVKVWSCFPLVLC